MFLQRSNESLYTRQRWSKKKHFCLHFLIVLYTQQCYWNGLLSHGSLKTCKNCFMQASWRQIFFALYFCNYNREDNCFVFKNVHLKGPFSKFLYCQSPETHSFLFLVQINFPINGPLNVF